MEYENPWADKYKKVHKNVKSVKPEPKIIKNNKSEEEKNREFIEELVEHAFSKLDKKSEEKVIKIFGDSYVGAIRETEKLKEEILGSLFLPDRKTMIMLGYLCMLQEAIH